MIYDIVLTVLLISLAIIVLLFYKAMQALVKKNNEEHHLLNANDSILMQEITKLSVLGNKVNDINVRIFKTITTIKNNNNLPSDVVRALEKTESDLETARSINKSLLHTIASIKTNMNRISHHGESGTDN
jgi:biopolymer transport protein ExbB/TolQ